MPVLQPPAIVAAPIPRDTTLVIDGATIIDVQTGARVNGSRVVIRQRKITAVGPASRTAIPAGARRIDARGQFLIPGLWDMHVHSAYMGLGTIMLPLYVANGVTGVREMFGQLFAMRAYRTQIDTGSLIGPRIVGSGHILDGPKPIWPNSVTAANAAEGRRAVDSLKAAGADFIKVYSVLPREAYFAIATRAKEVGIPFAGHIPGGVTAFEASSAGQHSVEHLTNITLTCSRDETTIRRLRDSVRADVDFEAGRALVRVLGTREIDSFDAARCDSLYRQFVRNNTWQVPTMTVLRNMAGLDTIQPTDPRLAFIPKFLVQGWDPTQDFRLKERTAAGWASAKRFYATQRTVVGAMARAGVPLLAGTDVLNPYVLPGFSLHDELQLLVSAGLSPLAALQAATISPARFLAATDSMGTVGVGKVADLVLLDADPLLDISNTTKIRSVIARGRYYDRRGLDAILAEAKARQQ
jgi:hypothetical protein